MLVIVVYIPNDFADSVIKAMHESGAGHIGVYEDVCFKSQGISQFRPMAGAVPFIGEVGRLEQVDETKVEMVCEHSVIGAVLKAMILAHPYEEVAHHVIEVKTAADFIDMYQ